MKSISSSCGCCTGCSKRLCLLIRILLAISKDNYLLCIKPNSHCSISKSTYKYLRLWSYFNSHRRDYLALGSYKEWPLIESDLKFLNFFRMFKSIANKFLSSRLSWYTRSNTGSYANYKLLSCAYFSPQGVQCFVNLLLKISILVFVSTYSLSF